MKKNLMCQEKIDYNIWGAVSVIIIRRNIIFKTFCSLFLGDSV